MSDLYEIKPSLGKGLGVFANVDIKQGDVIMEDKARMKIVNYHKWVSEYDIQKVFDPLSPADKKEFPQLHSGTLSQSSTNMRIYSANAFSIGGEDAGIMYFKIARVNHSCMPNSEMPGSDDGTGTTKLHAIQPIRKGEETFHSCLAGKADGSKADRQQHLERVYGFVCGCATCSLTGTELAMSDARRTIYMALNDKRVAAMSELLKPTASPNTSPDREQVASNFLMARMMEAEGWTSALIGDCYFMAVVSLLDQLKRHPFTVLATVKLAHEWVELAFKQIRASRPTGSMELQFTTQGWAYLQAGTPNFAKAKKAVSSDRLCPRRTVDANKDFRSTS